MAADPNHVNYIFTGNLHYHVWTAEEADSNPKRYRRIELHHDKPILFLVKYRVNFEHRTLLQGYALPWTVALSRHFFPNKIPIQEFSRHHYGTDNLPSEIEQWLYFSRERIVQEISPRGDIAKLMEWIQPTATSRSYSLELRLRTIIRNFQDVNPVALRAYTDNEEIIREAQIVLKMRELMKQFSKVWLLPSNYVMLRVESLQGAMALLISDGYVRKRIEDDAIAFTWAADQHDKFMTERGLVAGRTRGYHHDQIKPTALHKIPANQDGEIHVDRTWSVDRMVDVRCVTNSMLDLDWQDERQTFRGDARIQILDMSDYKTGLQLLRSPEYWVPPPYIARRRGDNWNIIR